MSEIDIDKIKAGDSVRIANGDWYEVENDWCKESSGIVGIRVPVENRRIWYTVRIELITGHRPAKPEPEPQEWVTVGMMAEVLYADVSNTISALDLKDMRRLNTLLTRKYGEPPIVRTYNGEPPEEVKELLQDTLEVLCDEPDPVDGGSQHVIDLQKRVRYTLEKLKQPPAPEGE